ncbi:uncharacterized protein B0H64DRAFT_307906, partial [Chaetomium fimeti]
MDSDDPVEPSAGCLRAPATSNCRCYGTSSKVFCHLGIISTIGVERAPAVIGRPPAASVTIAGVPDAAGCRAHGSLMKTPAAKPGQVTSTQQASAEPAIHGLLGRGEVEGGGGLVSCEEA